VQLALSFLCAMLGFLCAMPGPAHAQWPGTEDQQARQAFDASLPVMRALAPDEVLDRLRRQLHELVSGRITASFQDPYTRRIDTLVEKPWPELRRRCAAGTAPLSPDEALASADALLGDLGLAPRPSAAPTLLPGMPRRTAPAPTRGEIAAMLAALDQRVCRCADRPSLALAADCAS
jgi:hypothetical protein